MGGARCSYRNCTQKSDKKTHMFHYPVFDKLRCHQWITNAQKQDYFNLKLSQLKNRMICEHHFKDYCFMNIMRNKLKMTAIPTEDGPFCTKSCKTENQTQHNKDLELPINIDDIENEFMPKSNKQAYLSVNYGDFLTNEISEISLTPEYKNTSIMLQDKGMVFNRFDRKTCTSQKNHTSLGDSVRKIDYATKPIAIAPKIETKQPSPKVVSIEYDEHTINSNEQNKVIPKESLKPNSDSLTVKSKSTVPFSKKVKIISEKHISEPVKIPPGELQPVSPFVVIAVPDKKSQSNIQVDGQDVKTLYLNQSQKTQQTKNLQNIDNSANMKHLPLILVKDDIDEYTKSTMQVNQVNVCNTVPQNMDIKSVNYLPLNGNFIQPSVASPLINITHNVSTIPNIQFVSCSLASPAVFTLTDIPQDTTFTHATPKDKNGSEITDLLLKDSAMTTPILSLPITQTENTLRTPKNVSIVNEKETPKANPVKSLVRKLPPEKLAAIEEKRKYNLKLRDIISSSLNNIEEEPDVGKLTAALKKEISNKKVGEHLSKNSNQPQTQENIIAYFETRLQRMEDTLLNKIENNSQKILDIRKTLKQSSTKKTTGTQTYLSAQATKRSLYEQISKYLNSDTNSLIYEQLFLNHDSQRIEHKKRKRRSNND